MMGPAESPLVTVRWKCCRKALKTFVASLRLAYSRYELFEKRLFSLKLLFPPAKQPALSGRLR
jgi:hypothetical protein